MRRQIATLAWDGEVDLADGRRLAFTSMGRPRGFPVLYFHGAIGTSPLAAQEFRSALSREDIRVVMVHRPGFASSTPCPDRNVASFAADVNELRHALGFASFSIVAVSAGVPYGLACAARLGAELRAVSLASSIPPPGCSWSRLTPLARLASGAIPDDFRVYTSDWGFDPEAVRKPVSFWHGCADPIAPIAHARRLAAAVPTAELIPLPGEGHFFFRRRVEEILDPLVPQAPAVRDAYAASA